MLRRPWKILEQLYLHTKWFIQRGWRGYSDSDVWDIDCYISHWMPSALRRLRHSGNSYPADLSGRDEWDKILDEMILGFEATRKVQELEFGSTEEERSLVLAQANRGLELFRRHYFDLWD